MWKDRYRVTSRHITKIVSVKTKRDKEKTKKQVEDLQKKVEAIVAEHPDICIWNCDQSGLVKEAVGKRTLARKGEKKIEVVCQSKSATTSSITLLPSLMLSLFPFETFSKFLRFFKFLRSDSQMHSLRYRHPRVP
ncbi:hypothetical protein PFISCL1PPCAC_19852 [Pristionchus fissidentatus]|uniref:Ribosomal protein n=1 Tax=Pristionchus fissidentatus TaxID=1538716 RepID=A0AAV5WD43_9BILA|nr:hypothetical protein PFISCL1PPCAC_19852 [Pristionchus fissidentatus]